MRRGTLVAQSCWGVREMRATQLLRRAQLPRPGESLRARADAADGLAGYHGTGGIDAKQFIWMLVRAAIESLSSEPLKSQLDERKN